MSIGRISTAETYRSAISAVTTAQEFVNRTQEQMGSGKKILRPSDDPVASAQIAGIRDNLSRIENYRDNTTRADSVLAYADDTLAGAEDVLFRVRDLVIQAQNAALDPEDLNSLGREVDGLLDRMISLGNTQNADGEYIFAGFASTTQPYQRDGAGGVTELDMEGVREVNIGPGLRVQVTDTGADIFVAEPGNGKFTVAANTGNVGTGAVGATTATSAFDDTLDYTVSFQLGAGGDLEWVVNDGVNPPVTGVYSDGDAIPLNGGAGSLVINGQPDVSDVFNVTGNRSIPASAPGNNGFTATPDAGNTGSAIVVETDTTDSFDDTLSYSLTFQAGGTTGTQWVVDDGSTTTVGDYTAGEPIVFDGGNASLTLTGAPALTDSFALEPRPVEREQSVFKTLVEIRDALLSDNDSAAKRAVTTTALSQSLENLDNNLAQISLKRTDIGVRLNRIEGQVELNSAFDLQLERTLADLEALDYAEAISALNLQLVALQAAQQTFVKTTGITLFDYL